MGERLVLVAVEGPLKGRKIEIPEGGLRFGRSSSNSLHVPDEELSRNHCIFEREGDTGIVVIDLGSANGTFVNDQQLGTSRYVLKEGDTLEAGSSRFLVAFPSGSPSPAPSPATPPSATATPPPTTTTPSPTTLDLGLGSDSGDPPIKPVESKPISPAGALFAAAAIIAVVAIGVVMFVPMGGFSLGKDGAKTKSTTEAIGAVKELLYEKVDADSSRIFRYAVTLDGDGTLRAVYDDVPGENRHADKSVKLSKEAHERLEKMFASAKWRELDAEYTGPSASAENALKSRRIRVVGETGAKEVSVVNTVEPEGFEKIRGELEAFSRNELGVWALEHSREQLIAFSAEAKKLGDEKWNERDVAPGNIRAALNAYREAVMHLETVNPKPEGYDELKRALDRARSELDGRYKSARFLADQALNMKDWDKAREELRNLCDLVADKRDERYIEANAKLVDVEARLRSEKNGGKRK